MNVIQNSDADSSEMLTGADSMWSWLMRPPERRALSKLRWKILQRGEKIESHWADLRELWTIEQRVALDSIPLYPKRLLTVRAKQRDNEDGTTKWLLGTHDGHLVEAVLIPTSRTNRATACISSQVGCGVKCSFCATGKLGMIRQLTAPEILEQLLVVREQALLESRQLRNVVFMGMGEPLHNWPNVQSALDFILRDDGFYFSPAHVCVSTAGVMPRIIECARTFPKIRLAISLHSCDPAIRRQIVPRGVASIDQLRACVVQLNQEFPERVVWLEVVMLDGVTDRDRDIELLVDFCSGLNVEINLIPYNSTKVSNSESNHMSLRRSERTWEFAQRLRQAGFFTTIRYSGGQNIAAACGQLAGQAALQGELPVVEVAVDN